MKKRIAIYLVFSMLMLSMNVYAQELNDSTFPLDSSEGLDLSDYEETYEEFMRLGEIARLTRDAGSLSVTHYYQDGGQSWSNDYLGGSTKTIAQQGCALTSFAMVETFFGGGDDPGACNKKLGSSAYPLAYQAAGEKYGLTVKTLKMEKVSDGNAKTFIVGAIMSGSPVIVGLHTDTGDGTHFVVAYAYAYSGSADKISIHDPASNRDYTNIDQYLENYYVDRLCVYIK